MSGTKAAINALEQRRNQLTTGLDSIAEQQKNLEVMRKSVETNTRKLAQDKTALVEIDNALNILRAGEPA